MITQRQLVEDHRHPFRLGRHIRHDSRSRAFAVRGGAPITSVLHRPNDIIALDQGNLGACTGFAAAKCLSTAPFTNRFDSTVARGVYSDATKSDSYPGSWPPDDTGSDGLSVMKVCVKRGWIKSYQWAFNLDQALSALMERPGICGIEWRDDMFTPDDRGRVKPSGAIAGGHEVCMIGYDRPHEEIILVNSWGPGFGVVFDGITGVFRIRVDDFAALLATGGDVTFPDLL
jgi:hypothetical protein